MEDVVMKINNDLGKSNTKWKLKDPISNIKFLGLRLSYCCLCWQEVQCLLGAFSRLDTCDQCCDNCWVQESCSFKEFNCLRGQILFQWYLLNYFFTNVENKWFKERHDIERIIWLTKLVMKLRRNRFINWSTSHWCLVIYSIEWAK